jgi:hypothetical protein
LFRNFIQEALVPAHTRSHSNSLGVDANAIGNATALLSLLTTPWRNMLHASYLRPTAQVARRPVALWLTRVTNLLVGVSLAAT